MFLGPNNVGRGRRDQPGQALWRLTDSEIRSLTGASLSNGVAMPSNIFMWLVSSNKTVLTEPPRTPEGQFHIRRILRQDRRVFSAIYQQEGRGELDTRLNGRAKSFLGDQDAHAGCGAQFHVTMGLRSVYQRVAVGN
jgi:hypothetical protein